MSGVHEATPGHQKPGHALVGSRTPNTHAINALMLCTNNLSNLCTNFGQPRHNPGPKPQSGGFTPWKAAQELKELEDVKSGEHVYDAVETRKTRKKLLCAL